MSWAAFLFEIASGRMSSDELDLNYCSYFEGEGVFNRAMLPDAGTVPCESKEDPEWRVVTLFNLKCRNIFSSRACDEKIDDAQFDRARLYATGAILHVIQDSYAQGHCVRGKCEPFRGKVLAKVECLPIEMFTSYQLQSPDLHSQGDERPVAAHSCTVRSSIDDPVTASAKALWHIRNQSSREAFLADLERVFGNADAAARLPGADAGACFRGEAEE